MTDAVREVRVFVSSPGDVAPERGRVDAVVAKLNREYGGLVRFEPVLWEESVYKADHTFQSQIPEAAACDIVVSIFWTKIGTELPAEFAHMPDGRPYLSGTVYELLTALEASKKRGVPDVYVFRKTADAALPTADAQLRRQAEEHLDALEAFWSESFKSERGQFKAAYQTFDTTDAFEQQLEKLLRQWLQSHDMLGPRLVWPKEKGSPFRGLAPFEAEHIAVFFGRDRTIDEARRCIAQAAERGAPFLLIVGASGSGKSSLARAGLIPRLTTPGVVAAVDVWRVARMKPSEEQAEPLLALATALFAKDALPELDQGDFPNAAMLAGHFKRGGEAAAQPVIRGLERAAAAAQHERHADRSLRPTLVLLVDQLEELFAKGVSDADRAAFAENLDQLVATRCIWIVATLRADFYELAIKEPTLKALKEAGATLDLGPPGLAELADIVRAPARAAGLTYESDPAKGALDDRLLADATTPDSLPLLQFALQQLYERRVQSGDEARLTYEAYDALGGLAGAIAAEAERAVSGLRPEAVATLPRLLRRLAEPAHDGQTLTLREALISEAATDASEAALLDALRAAFVVIAGTDAQGRPTVRLAHNAVFQSWPRAKDAAQANRDFLRVRAEVEGALGPWQEHGRPSDRLLQPGVPLAEAEDLVRRFRAELPAELTTYVKASGDWARLRQRLVAAAAGFFFVLAVAATVASIWAYRAQKEAVAQHDRAQQALATISQIGNSLVLDVRQEFVYRRMPMDLLGRILDPAIRGYDQAIQLDLANAAVYTNRGAAYGAKDDYDAAIRDHDQAIRLDPKSAFAYRNRGIAYDAKGQHDRAIQDFDQAIQLDPTFVSAYLNRAIAQEGKGDTEGAIRDYDEAIRLVPKDNFDVKAVMAYDAGGSAYLNRGFAYERNGDRGRAIQDYDRAIQDYDQAIRLDPKGALAYRDRGLAYVLKGDFDHAIQDYDQATRLDSKNVAINYLGRGMAYERKQDYSRAIQDYDEAIRLNPTYVDAYRARAGAYQSKGEYRRAIQDFDQEIELDPKSAAAYENRGLTYELDRNNDRALKDYEKAIELDPNDASAYASRGRIYAIKRDYDRAIQDYDQAIQIAPKKALAYRGRGQAYDGKGDHDRAIQDFDEAIRLDPNNAAAYNSRGVAYLNERDYARAIQDYDQAIQLDPKSTLAYTNRGNAYVIKREYDRAIQDCDRAIQLDPKSAIAHITRSLAYDLKGDHDRAIQDYDQAIRLDPRNERAYLGRGNAYLNKREYDRAIQDYDQAIQINPRNGATFASSGRGHFHLGNFKAAAEALLRANELEDDAYTMIFLYLARERAGGTGAAELEANAARLKSKNWPYPVIELFLGKRSPAGVLAIASEANERCEAQFYGGEYWLLNGDRAAAGTALKAAVDTCPKEFGSSSISVAVKTDCIR